MREVADRGGYRRDAVEQGCANRLHGDSQTKYVLATIDVRTAADPLGSLNRR